MRIVPVSRHGLFKDITGRKINRWLVISYAGSYKWNCKCDCGTVREVPSGSLLHNTTKSCGCHRREATISRCLKHGAALLSNKTVEYTTWTGIKKRCLNPKAFGYENYGGRGITICERWINSFEDFYADMGSKPSPFHSIDRVDVDGNYEPANCRWATRKEQANNTRKQKLKKELCK